MSIFINNNTGVALTNTFVGTVAINSIPGSTTNSLVAGNSFVSSILPVAGGVTSVLGLTNSAGALDGTQLYIPNIVSGNVNGYTTITFDSGFASGFGDASDLNQVSEPTIQVGAGFIFNNNAGAGTIQWQQSL